MEDIVLGLILFFSLDRRWRWFLIDMAAYVVETVVPNVYC